MASYQITGSGVFHIPAEEGGDGGVVFVNPDSVGKTVELSDAAAAAAASVVRRVNAGEEPEQVLEPSGEQQTEQVPDSGEGRESGEPPADHAPSVPADVHAPQDGTEEPEKRSRGAKARDRADG